MSTTPILLVLPLLALLPFVTLESSTEAAPEPNVCLLTEASDAGLPADPKFLGAKKCKSCHNDEATGSVYDKWEAGPHAKAFETLAGAEAKSIAKELGIEDPQKSDKCLKCHITGFGLDKEMFKKGFEVAQGVQCETCHGAGEEHFKVRFKEKMKKVETPAPIGEGETHSVRDPKFCLQCHNDESPTYKDFCFKEKMAKIEHLNPQRERSEEDLKKLRAVCLPDCPKCSKKKDG